MRTLSRRLEPATSLLFILGITLAASSPSAAQGVCQGFDRRHTITRLGGPNAFGAGGWIGSPLEDALPIKLDPPQKRQMPRGALVLNMHSVEMPDGVFYGKKVCESAVNSLSRLDLAGIIEGLLPADTGGGLPN